VKKQAFYATLMTVGLLFSGLAGTNPKSPASNETPATFQVEFGNCVESIGVGLIPTEQAQALVPAEFHVVGEGQPLTPLVVRTADCGDISVDGYSPKAGSIVQIGVVIVPPDITGDINNYTFWYYTSDAKLAHHLERVGINAQQVANLDYDYDPEGGGPTPLNVRIDQSGELTLRLDGMVVESTTPAGSFAANWWVKTDHGFVKMETRVPQIFIGSASLLLTTNPNNTLGQLIGGTSTSFPILEQFNSFANAHLTVRSLTP
jgi:hypothetical protein